MNTFSKPVQTIENKEKELKHKEVQRSPELKGGHFLLGETLPEDIFIPEEWDEEQKMLADTVIDFFMQEVHALGIEKMAQIDAEKDLDFILEIFHKAADMGFCGVAIDEQYGGMNLDFNTNLIISEALSRGFAFATTIGAQTSIGSLPIVYYGTETQKDQYLPGIAAGTIKACYCLTEPTAGSDANSGKTKATLTEDGKYYLLNGQKMWITNGGFADLFIVFAKIEDDKKLSAFIVEKDFGGITIGKEEKKLGIKASSTTQVFFEDTLVPVENLLGDREGGFKMALNILNTGRIKLCAGTVGGAKFGVEKAVQYANQRKQFGKSIAEFGAIKYKLGEMVMRTHVTESALYRTGKNIDQKYEELLAAGQSDSEAKINALREYAIECAILKVQGSEVATYTADEALQIHGGMGFAVETGVEMGYRDVRITRIYEGTNEINRMLSVAELTKRALKTKELDLIGAGKQLPRYLFTQIMPFKSNSKGAMEWRIVHNLKQLFILLSGAAGNKLKEKMVDEQEIVMNLADILSLSFLAESALLRYEKYKAMPDADSKHAAMQYQVVQLYLYEALQSARKWASEVIDSYAGGLEKRGMRYLVKQLTPNYNINPKALRRAVADYAIEKNAYPF